MKGEGNREEIVWINMKNRGGDREVKGHMADDLGVKGHLADDLGVKGHMYIELALLKSNSLIDRPGLHD